MIKRAKGKYVVIPAEDWNDILPAMERLMNTRDAESKDKYNVQRFLNERGLSFAMVIRHQDVHAKGTFEAYANLAKMTGRTDLEDLFREAAMVADEMTSKDPD